MKAYHLFAAALCVLLSGCNKEPSDTPGGKKSNDLSPSSELVDNLPKTEGLQNMAVHTDKAAYSPGESVKFTSDRQQSVVARYWHLGKVVGEELLEDSKSWTWTPPSTDFQGYYLELVGKNGEGEVKTVGKVAVDVSSDWTRFPRYGFLSKFGDVASSRIKTVLEDLKNYHINGIQYYDWMYDHHHPLAGTPESPASEWPSIIGDKCYRSTVSDYIFKAHEYGMASMFYDLCYGALSWAETDGVRPEWYAYKDKDHSSRDHHALSAPFRSSIYLVDPGNEGWLEYFSERVDEVYAVFDFDGFHIDQLGDRGLLYDYNGKSLDMPGGYGKFLTAMNAARPDKKLAFNAVSRYGQKNIAGAPTSFLYNEVWETKFSDLVKIFNENRSFAPDKNTVFAAYMNYKQSGYFNTPSVLLADAVIFALGGSHLELGEHMLCNEYFPSATLKMDARLQAALPAYYDFLTGYENILRDGWEQTKISLSSDEVAMGAFGPYQFKVNYLATKKGNSVAIQLLNFLDAAHLDWRDDKRTQKEPATVENFKVSFTSPVEVSYVWIASPDINGGVPRKAEFTASGNSVTVTVPSLKYWTMIVVE